MSLSSQTHGLLTILYELRRKRGNVEELDEAIGVVKGRIYTVDSDPELVTLPVDNAEIVSRNYQKSAQRDKMRGSFFIRLGIVVVMLALAAVVYGFLELAEPDAVVSPMITMIFFAIYTLALVIYSFTYRMSPFEDIGDYFALGGVLYLVFGWVLPILGFLFSFLVLREMEPVLAVLPPLMLAGMIGNRVIAHKRMKLELRNPNPREEVMMERAQEADAKNQAENVRRREQLLLKLNEKLTALQKDRDALWDQVEHNGYVQPEDLERLSDIITLLERGAANTIPEALAQLK